MAPLAGARAQIALEFLIVYSFVLIVFVLIFSVIATQRAASLGQQQYSVLQLQVQNIASYIDQAVQAGTGYSATVPLINGLTRSYYNLSISTTGVVIGTTQIGPQPIVAYGFSHARSFVINGTLTKSGNGVSIYQIPTYKGTITIYNLRGTIYIDEIPPSTSSLVQGAVIVQQSNVKAAAFNGQNAKMTMPNSASLNPTNQITVSAWVYANSSTTATQAAVSKITAGNTNGYFLGTTSGWSNLAFYVVIGGVTKGIAISYPLLGGWHNIVGMYNGVTVNAYVDGALVGTYPVSGAITTGNTNLTIGNKPGFSNWFSGKISNVQIYNASLNANQVSALYSNGISGGPVSAYNLMGWWSLNGNGNDYSGLGNQGTPSNLTNYQGVLQFNARTYSLSGNGISNTLVGFVTSEGLISGPSQASSEYTNSNSVASAFVTGASGSGSGNFEVELFNGNSSTTGNLIGWWPLDTGYGSNAYDLSTSVNNGFFSGALWKQSVNQTNFMAANFESSTGNFIQVNSISLINGNYVQVNSTQSLLNIVTNKTFTIVAWVYYGGQTSGNQGIFGDWSGFSGGQGFELEGYCSSCTNNAVLRIAGNSLSFPGSAQSFPANTWEMISAQYNGATGATAVYLNNMLFASGTLPRNLQLLSILPYYIGTDSYAPTTDTFNGLITNVQLYDSYLSKQQISSIYSNGGASAPLGNGGLVGWWPLLNTTSDYSNNMDSGTYNGIVRYVNSAFNSTPQLNAPYYATFNEFNEISIPYTSTLGKAGPLTVSFWFDSFNGASSVFDSDMVNGAPTLHGFDAQLCGGAGNRCGFIGINTSIGSGGAYLANAQYQFQFRQNTWYSLTETFNSGTWTIYVNGNMVASGTYSGNPDLLGETSGLAVGGPGKSGTSYFNGQIADLQVYNTALTAQQALQLYIQGLPVQYKLNESVD